MIDKIKEINGRLDESKESEFQPKSEYKDRFKVVKGVKKSDCEGKCGQCGGDKL